MPPLLRRKMFIDAHCHLTGSDLEVKTAIHAARNAGLTRLFLGGIDPDDWQNQLKIRKIYGEIIGTSFGLHPWFINRYDELQCSAAFTLLLEHISNRCHDKESRVPTGIGETGLDYAVARTAEEKHRQRKWFKRHLDISLANNIPIVIHCVRAYGATLRCMDQALIENDKPLSGMIHGFNGDRSIIKQFAARNMLLSVGPNAFATNHQTDLAHIPDNLLTIESDAPQGSLSRHHHPTKDINSSIVFEVAEKIATHRGRGETTEEVLYLSAKNFIRVFG